MRNAIEILNQIPPEIVERYGIRLMKSSASDEWYIAPSDPFCNIDIDNNTQVVIGKSYVDIKTDKLWVTFWTEITAIHIHVKR